MPQETRLKDWERAALTHNMSQAEWLNGGYIKAGWFTALYHTKESIEIPEQQLLNLDGERQLHLPLAFA